MTARIFDGFLLPALRFAPTQPAYQTSRKNILRSAFTLYQETTQDDKAQTVLLLMRESPLDQNTKDWTSLQLGAEYASTDQLGKAIAVLKTVQSPSMKGSVAFLPVLRQERDDQNPNAPVSQAIKANHSKPASRHKARLHKH